jgi:hypothetical protein
MALPRTSSSPGGGWWWTGADGSAAPNRWCRPPITGHIVEQPLDGDRQAIDRAETMLDGSEHQIMNILAADAAGGGEETHGLAITPIECEGDRTRSPLSQPIRPASQNASRCGSRFLSIPNRRGLR